MDMIYLSGAVNKYSMTSPDLGIMLTPMMGNNPDLTGVIWAADNGCFATPEKYSDEMYLAFLRKQRKFASTCLFATLPDVLGNAEATLKKSRPLVKAIRGAGYRPALVAQDGLEKVKCDYAEFDTLFIGGSTEWKLSVEAAEVAKEAAKAGCGIHMGRVNSLHRMIHASFIGCGSVDGTYLAFGSDRNFPNLNRWLQFIHRQDRMAM